VYGGCDEGNVTGNPEVIVVPKKYSLDITNPGDGNVLRITDERGTTVALTGTGTYSMDLDEYANLWLEAVPNAQGSSFTNWNVTNGSVVYKKKTSTIFTMGAYNANANATLEAVFDEHATTHSFSYSASNGTITVTDGQFTPQNVPSGTQISEGAVLNIVATAASGYAFKNWSITSGNGTIANVYARSTTFTMGTNDAVITAVFESAPHNLTITPPANGIITVTDNQGQTVSTGTYVVEGTSLNIMTTAYAEYAFSHWNVTGGTVEEPYVRSTRFVMGNSNAELSADIVSAPYTLSFALDPALSGHIVVKDQYNQHLNSGSYVPNGTQLNIIATPAVGYLFDHWEITDGSGTIGNASEASTTFTMGNMGNVTITAHFRTSP
jgi:hypothetical protein